MQMHNIWIQKIESEQLQLLMTKHLYFTVNVVINVTGYIAFAIQYMHSKHHAMNMHGAHGKCS